MDKISWADRVKKHREGEQEFPTYYNTYGERRTTVLDISWLANAFQDTLVKETLGDKKTRKKITLRKQEDPVQSHFVHHKSYLEFPVNEPGQGRRKTSKQPPEKW
jgi:hypothetical protein